MSREGRRLILFGVLVISLFLIFGGPLVRQHCGEIDQKAARAYVKDRKKFLRQGRAPELELKVESTWMLGFTFAASDDCVNNTPARELANSTGITAPARDQIQHKRDADAKEGL